MSSLIQGYQIGIPFNLSGSEGSFLFSGSYIELNSATSSTDFFIIKESEFETLPVDMTQHFEQVMTYGRYIMLHARGNESK